MILNMLYQYMLSSLTTVADNPETTEQEKSAAANRYLLLYPLCNGTSLLLGMANSILLMLKGIQASKVIHGNIIDNLLKASIQKFYNVILNSRI